MSLNIFSVKNKYYRNGIFWFTKILNRIVGQQRYDSLRVSRRTFTMKCYYYRQQLLYQCFIQSPDVACMLGIYPKIDSSHGYPFVNTYQMYRDFQENTISSDGSFAWWIMLLSGIYTSHVVYNYILPWYWNRNAPMRNGEQQRLRMRDAIASTILQDQYGFQHAQWGFTPHGYHSMRKNLMQGYSHPDDVRLMHLGSVNRKHRYRQHYLKIVGGDEQKHMTHL